MEIFVEKHEKRKSFKIRLEDAKSVCWWLFSNFSFAFFNVLCFAFIRPSFQIVLNINFSSRTTSLDVQRTVEASTEKRTKNIFGPPVGKKLIAFVDDMNMPKVDNYGTQQPIALLKLLIEHHGMYDRGKDLNWKIFKDICK